MCQLVTPCDAFWTEKRYPINQPEKLGIPRSYATIRRWIVDGYTSQLTGEVVQLEGINEGQELVTTRESYTRFLKKLNGFLPKED